MGSLDVDFDVDFLAGDVFVDIPLVVGELVPFAEPEIAFRGVVIALAGGDLQLALDVTVVVVLLTDFDLLAAGSCHRVTGHSGSRASDKTMAVDQRDDAGEGQDGSELLHFAVELGKEWD